MKVFNKTIKVEVSVDAIANQLLQQIVDNNPHREMIVETIIQTAINNDTLNYLYNSLNGYTNEINFNIGDFVECTEHVYQYIESEQKYISIGNCTIVEIDIYRNNKVRVEYDKYKKDGNIGRESSWVSHTSLNVIKQQLFDI